jgi:hypothetical protein
MEIDRILEQFTDPLTGSLHGAVFIVVDRSGTVATLIHIRPPDFLLCYFRLFRIETDNGTGKEIYNNAVGKASFDSNNTNTVNSDSLCWIASMTKLVTAVAVMQLVERGVISLDDDVRGTIPELRDMTVFENRKPSTN